MRTLLIGSEWQWADRDTTLVEEQLTLTLSETFGRMSLDTQISACVAPSLRAPLRGANLVDRRTQCSLRALRADGALILLSGPGHSLTWRNHPAQASCVVP